jgi:hypothetical protein
LLLESSAFRMMIQSGVWTSLEQLKASRSRVRLSDEVEGVKTMSELTVRVIEPMARVGKVSKPMPEIEPAQADPARPLASKLLDARRKKRE